LSYIGQRPVVGRYIKLDQISSGFNGSNTGFSMTAGSQAVFPGTARNLLLSLGGVIQEPDTDFTISGSTLTFTTPPVANTTFFGVIYGDMQATGTPSDGTVLPASIASSGNFSFPEVTVTGDVNIADSIIHSGDTDTKIRFPANNQISFETTGSEGVRIDENGRLGIGDDNPSQLLTVKGSSPIIRIQENQSGGSKRLDLGVTNSGGIGFIGTNQSASSLTFQTVGFERMRIDASGRLLLNMSTSVTGGGFQVNNTFNTFFSASNDTQGCVLQLEKTRSTSPGSYTIVQDGDKLGELQFKGSNGSASVLGANIQAIVNGTPGSGNDLPTDLAFRLMPDGSGSTLERMRITSSGNVGIGTTSPQRLLHLSSNNTVFALTDTAASTDQKTKYILSDAGALAFGKLNDAFDTATEYFRVTNDGKFGIGTNNPDFEFQVEDSSGAAVIRAKDGANNKIVDLIANSTGGLLRTIGSYPLVLNTNQTERMRIDSSGLVRIHNTNMSANSAAHSLIVGTSATAGDAYGISIFAGSSGSSNIFFADSDGAQGDRRGTLRYFHGTDQFQLNTAGNNLGLCVDSSQRVGINTSSPAAKLAVHTTTTNNSSSQLFRITTANGALFGIETDETASNPTWKIGGLVNSGTAEPLAFYQLGSEVARIHSSGNVGIGTSNPTGVLEIDAASTTDMIMLDVGGANFARIGHNTSGGSNMLDVRSEGHTRFLTGGNNERLRIDSSGNVGIGTSSPVNNSGYGGITLNGGSGAIFSFKDSDVEKTRLALVVNDAFSIQYPPGSSGHFRIDSLSADGSGNITGATERLRVHSGGEISFQTTSINLQGGGASDFMFTMRSDIGSNHNGVMIAQVASGHAALTTKPSGSHDYFAGFFLNNSSSGVGSIQITASATIFNTSSDYRLKENAVSISDGITRLKQLLPKRFNWIADETNTLQDGFFAHEVSSIVPEAVTGEKDAIATEDGGQYTKDEPIYQQIDHSKLVPLLTAALKEAISKIETLETKVAALEAA